MNAASPASQQTFDFDFTGLPAKSLLRVDEVAKFLRYSDDTIRMMVVGGELEAHRREGDRTVMTITRRSVEAFMAKSAQYEPRDLLPVVKRIVARMSPAHRHELLEHLHTLR